VTEVRDVATDLRAEQEALDGIVAGLTDEQWGLSTPSPGWSVADQIGHLTYFDGAAATAIADPAAFTASVEQLMAADDRDALTLHRHLSPQELLAAWRANRSRLADVATALEDSTRVAWYGPSMGAKSFLSARLMECWAHGQDVADALDIERAATDRLQPPAGDVRVELTGPSGARWHFGPDDAVGAVTGPALDFCLVVTQRRHPDDTALQVTGEIARDWLARAQAFAGPPTDGPAPRSA
jgi:uncharacterized protein (TIGR03083 family)